MKRKVKEFFMDLEACIVLLVLLFFAKIFFYFCVCTGMFSKIELLEDDKEIFCE